MSIGVKAWTHVGDGRGFARWTAARTRLDFLEPDMIADILIWRRAGDEVTVITPPFVQSAKMADLA